MAATRASKSAPKPSLYVDRDGGLDAEQRVAELERRLAQAEQTLRAVVEELKARKVLPAVTVVRGPKRVVMSPEAVRAQRQELLATAREARWPGRVSTRAALATMKPPPKRSAVATLMSPPKATKRRT